MKIIATLGFVLFFTLLANAQKTLESIVLDAETREPIPFVNIGIFKKRFGTVSDENGRFTLQIPESLQKDSLSFSSVGYSVLSLPIRELMKNPLKEIYLLPKINQLQEVTVNSKKLKEKIKGERIAINLFQTGISGSYAGYEIGQIIRTSKMIKLKTLELQVQHISAPDLLFRLNLYDLKNDMPAEKMTIPNIIFNIEKASNFTLDLSDYNLLVASDFYAGIEIIKISDSANGKKINNAFWGIGFGDKKENANSLILRAKKSRENIYFKIGSMSEWGQFNNVEMGMYFKVLE